MGPVLVQTPVHREPGAGPDRLRAGGLSWTLSLAPSLLDFFSERGIVASQPPGAGRGVWGVLDVVPGDGMVIGLFVALLVASLCLAAGFQTRIAAVIVFVGVLSFTRRDPYIFNAGDGLVRNIAFYMMLAPAGAALSLDRWRRHRDRFWEFPKKSLWSVRLMQIQLSVIYISAVWEKVRETPGTTGRRSHTRCASLTTPASPYPSSWPPRRRS